MNPGFLMNGTNNREHLQHLIEHAAHYLPAQGPITAFVHHNTLHAFEQFPFEEAVVKGGRLFGCHPYLPEDRYRRALLRGRIRPEDLEAVLMEDLGEEAESLLGFLGTRFHLRLAMLQYPLLLGPAVELRWVVEETDALRRFREETPQPVRERSIGELRHWVMRDLRSGDDGRGIPEPDHGIGSVREMVSGLFQLFDKSTIEQWSDDTWEAFYLHLLWRTCQAGVRGQGSRDEESPAAVRPRDLLLDLTGEDPDPLVHEVLIRFCGAFLDQGFGGWPLPHREQGFYRCFLALYGRAGGPPDRWLRTLRHELRRLSDAGIGPWESIAESLDLAGISPDEQERFITETLLALRGFAGMIWQVETRGDRVAHPVSQGSLAEFLAVRLILDRVAARDAARRTLGIQGSLPELREACRQRRPTPHANHTEQRAFLVFQLAQLLGWPVETLARLSRDEWSMLLHEVESFSGLERRRVYHLALERRYRCQTLDAVRAHVQGRRASGEDDALRPPAGEGSKEREVTTAPSFQVVCCIDEREESFRRHLEEIAPGCETFGAAGFFAVAMYYRGAADAHYTPLCPVIIRPQHYVNEDVVYTFEQAHHRRRKTRRTIGTVTHRVHVGSRTFAGGWAAAVLGSLASIPLVMRILFPRMTAQIRRVFGNFVRPPAVTRLQLERTADTPGPGEGQVGYNVQEMAVIVERLLRDIGLTGNFAPLVLILGHGSSSLNNPHEAAHDCGACGGGRGGPNARAFAQMANDLRVRQLVDRAGLQIPTGTVFIGAYHNTCDDSVTYYDLDRLPASHKTALEDLQRAVDQARARNAHERCRRFESAELTLSFEAALRHVEGRAEDLSQVRPEYGHATNALCFVGRREWSRGLFLDRRAFLQSYDPAQDDSQRTILTRILQAVIPVCGGINLEYYFSFVDPTGYGCGTKLPHNIASLVGVMNGAASDLRPGLPWQMVEIHEPVRLLFVIETTPEAMLQIIERNEGIARLCRQRWVQLATFDPATLEIHVFQNGEFRLYDPESKELPVTASSADWYRGWRDHLGFARIEVSPTQA